jgi:hypothetical protein
MAERLAWNVTARPFAVRTVIVAASFAGVAASWTSSNSTP